MIRRTSINLDIELVRNARRVLGTEGTTDTIHRALHEVVRHQRLEQLAARSFPDLTKRALERVRHTRAPRKAP